MHNTRINSLGFFSCAQIDSWKARERELATLDEKSTSSEIAEPYICAIIIEGKNRRAGGRRDNICDHGLFVQKLESRSVRRRKKQKKTLKVLFFDVISFERGSVWIR